MPRASASPTRGVIFILTKKLFNEKTKSYFPRIKNIAQYLQEHGYRQDAIIEDYLAIKTSYRNVDLDKAIDISAFITNALAS